MARYTQGTTTTPANIFRFGSEADCLAGILPISLVSGSRDPFGSHTPTTNLRRGLVLGKRSSDGRYGPLVRTRLSGTEASGQKVLSVDSTEGFAVGDNVYIRTAAWGSEFDCGAITAIGTNTITVTNALTSSYAAGSWLYLSNGLGVAKCVLNDAITVVDSDGDDIDGLDAHGIFNTGAAALLSGALPNMDQRALEELLPGGAAQANISFGP